MDTYKHPTQPTIIRISSELWWGVKVVSPFDLMPLLLGGSSRSHWPRPTHRVIILEVVEDELSGSVLFTPLNHMNLKVQYMIPIPHELLGTLIRPSCL